MDAIKTSEERLVQVTKKELERLQAKAARSEHLQELLDDFPAGIVILNAEGIVEESSRTAIELLNEPLKGEAWFHVIQRSFAPKKDDGHEVSLKDGRRVSIATRSLPDNHGQLVVLNDLTETRNLQSRVSHQERLLALGKMVANLAHQLRTPLSAATLYASHLTDSVIDQDQRERFGKKVQIQLQHIERQISDMLLFAKGGASLVDKISLSHLLDSLEQSLQAQIEQKGAIFKIENTLGDLSFDGNKEALLGALQNLVNNALEATGENAKITVLTQSTASEFIELWVMDNGPGIPQANIKKLLEPFYTTKSQGTGLGLSVVNSVAIAHQGQLLFDHGVSSGAAIGIHLPRTIQNKE